MKHFARFCIGLGIGGLLALAGSAHAAPYPVVVGGTGSTTLSGILKGAGTAAIKTAVSGTDFQGPWTLTVNNTSGAATWDGSTLNVPQYAGTVYGATYPVTKSGSNFGLAFGTTTSNIWGQTQTFTNNAIFSSTINSINVGQGKTLSYRGTGVGTYSLYANLTGYDNSAFGYASLYQSQSSTGNTALGSYALYTYTGGGDETAVGFNALKSQTTGANNTAVGHEALFSTKTGSAQTAIGTGALYTNLIGSGLTALGYNAGYYMENSTSTTALGQNAGYGTAAYSSTGNTLVGYYAGYRNGNNGNYNTLIGYQAGYYVDTGKNNIEIGSQQAPSSLINSGNDNILIGNDVQWGITNNVSKYLNIGNLIFANGVASSSILATGNVGIGTTSPTTRLDVWGSVRGINSATTTCDATTAGAMFYNPGNTHFWGCYASTWHRLDN
jgi:hypothetical protein